MKGNERKETDAKCAAKRETAKLRSPNLVSRCTRSGFTSQTLLKCHSSQCFPTVPGFQSPNSVHAFRECLLLKRNVNVELFVVHHGGETHRRSSGVVHATTPHADNIHLALFAPLSVRTHLSVRKPQGEEDDGV